MGRLSIGCAAGVWGLLLILAPLGVAEAEELPDIVVLDRLTQYYESVAFDHAGHLELAEGCASCHHHTTGSAPESETCATCHREGEPTRDIACASCHTTDPFSAEYLAEMEHGPQWFHVDKPGLKGAYHRSCLGCHEAVGGPAGCQDCHQRTAEGDALFSAGFERVKERPGASAHH